MGTVDLVGETAIACIQFGLPFQRGQSYPLGDLDKLIGDDDPVRLFDELLDAIDWKPWEREFAGSYGQPPIRPRILAGIILFRFRFR